MEIGMMWFDNDPKAALDVKLLRAAEYYAKKYGQRPNVAIVSLKDMGVEQVRVGGGVLVESNGMRVDSMKAILPGHLWIGVDQEEK